MDPNMKPLQAGETKLEGHLEVVDGRVRADDVTKRIEYLALHVLVKSATAAHGWDTLYVDPSNGRLGELTDPASHMHGGGPPQLEAMDPSRARDKYGV